MATFTRPYDRDQLQALVNRCTSYRELADALGHKPDPYANAARSLVRKFQLDAEHLRSKRKPYTYQSDATRYSPKKWKRGCTPWQQTLVLKPPGTKTSGDKLYRALISMGLEERCGKCRLGPVWQGKRLRLQVDHINGLRHDDRPENLRFLCPNCHSQTPTFCGRNQGRRKNRA